MKRTYLEVTFRKGKPVAAYLHLPRANSAKAARSDAEKHGMVVDFTATGAPFGVEITAPTLVELGALNDLLYDLNVDEVEPADLAPLQAA